MPITYKNVVFKIGDKGGHTSKGIKVGCRTLSLMMTGKFVPLQVEYEPIRRRIFDQSKE